MEIKSRRLFSFLIIFIGFCAFVYEFHDFCFRMLSIFSFVEPVLLHVFPWSATVIFFFQWVFLFEILNRFVTWTSFSVVDYLFIHFFTYLFICLFIYFKIIPQVFQLYIWKFSTNLVIMWHLACKLRPCY